MRQAIACTLSQSRLFIPSDVILFDANVMVWRRVKRGCQNQIGYPLLSLSILSSRIFINKISLGFPFQRKSVIPIITPAIPAK
jgi:hypothetical protein